MAIRADISIVGAADIIIVAGMPGSVASRN
jgi:hypothetical protein